MMIRQRKTSCSRKNITKKAVLAAALMGAGCGGRVDYNCAPDAMKPDAGVSCPESGKPFEGYSIWSQTSEEFYNFEFFFHTDLEFGLALRARLTSGAALIGDPEDLRDGDVVCAGSTLDLIPTSTARWAVSALSITAWYPGCDPGYCPQLQDYGCEATLNMDAVWLPEDVFEKHHSYAWDYLFTDDISAYHELGGFHPQPVTYKTEMTVGEPIVVHQGKLGGANVFCKGKLTIELDDAPLASTDVPPTLSTSASIDAPGEHEITVLTEDIMCFAAVVKHPLNIEEHQEHFMLYYYISSHKDMPTHESWRNIHAEPCD